MKNFIKKWLGINEIEAAVSGIKISIPKEIALRFMVGEAIEAAFDGKPDNKWNMYMGRFKEKNTLNLALKRASVSTAVEVTKSEVNKIVGSERFIDEVVARIQRKQLGG